MGVSTQYEEIRVMGSLKSWNKDSFLKQPFSNDFLKFLTFRDVVVIFEF